MGRYRLEDSAENDLMEIGLYTARTWGQEQMRSYLSALERHFLELSEGKVRTQQPLPHRPEFRSSRCQHHYVFSVREEADRVTVLAILHESMDLIRRLRQRLLDRGHDA